MKSLPTSAKRIIFVLLMLCCHDLQAQRFLVLFEYTTVTDVWPDHILLSDDPKALHEVKNTDITKELLVSKDAFDLIHSRIINFDTVLKDEQYIGALDVLYTTSELKRPICYLNTQYFLPADPLKIYAFFDRLIVDLRNIYPIDIKLIENLQRFVNSYWPINQK